MGKYILFKFLFYLIILIIRAKALIKFIDEDSETYEKREISSIYYEIYDDDGDNEILSYVQGLQNYDISITSNMQYNYRITHDTTYNLSFESDNECKPIYEIGKKIAITSVNDLFIHNCRQDKEISSYDILNVESLFDTVNLPELLIVQFNDIYELRNYLKSRDDEIFSGLCDCKFYNNKLHVTVMIKNSIVNDTTYAIPLDITNSNNFLI